MQWRELKLKKILGEGAAAVTYEGVDEKGSVFCVKRFKTGLDVKDQERFFREIEILKAIDHPQIPKFYDAYIQEREGRDILHLVMEKIEGNPLNIWLQNHRPTQEECLHILYSLLDILIYLHKKEPPIIHRDIKTHNIIRASDGSIFLIDFGQAVEDVYRTYGHSLISGTLGYQAPEQIEGEPVVKSDVYAVGAVALELLTGIPPREFLEGRRLRWERRCRYLPESLFRWLGRILEGNIQNRYSAAEAKQGVEEILYQLDAAENLSSDMLGFDEALLHAVRDHRQKQEDVTIRQDIEQKRREEQAREWDIQDEHLFLEMVRAWDKLIFLIERNKLNIEKGLEIFTRSFDNTWAKRDWGQTPDKLLMLLEFAKTGSNRRAYQEWIENRSWGEGSLIDCKEALAAQEIVVLQLEHQYSDLSWWDGLLQGEQAQEKLEKEKQLLLKLKEKKEFAEERVQSYLQGFLCTRFILDQEMILVPKGAFFMGAINGDKQALPDELPQHKIRLTQDLWMGKYPVRQELWEIVMEDNPSRIKGDNYPVQNVNWFDCIAFCNRLSEMRGLEPVYRIEGSTVACNWSANGYRLPTEAEREYAARAPVLATQGARAKYPQYAARAGEYTLYSGSNLIDEVGWCLDNSDGELQMVGQKRPNSFGFYDMSGNIWEWCMGYYDAQTYEAQAQKEEMLDPIGVRAGKLGVLRGGAWNFGSQFARVSQRFAEKPETRLGHFGFRIVQRVSQTIS